MFATLNMVEVLLVLTCMGLLCYQVVNVWLPAKTKESVFDKKPANEAEAMKQAWQIMWYVDNASLNTLEKCMVSVASIVVFCAFVKAFWI